MLLELYGPSAPVYPASILQPPLWSPDDQALAFTDANELLLVETADQTAQPTRITRSIPENAALQWNVNGRLRFATPGRREVQRYEAVLDESEPRLVRSWPVNFLQTRPPVFAPDGSRFIIAAIHPNALNLELYLFDAETDAVENLSNRPLFNDSGAVWSPDGRAIVYQSYNDAGQFLILDSLDGAAQTILHHVKSGFIQDVTWSPDQTSLSFFLSYVGQHAICIFTLASATLDCPIADAETMNWRPVS
jgi:Tol biopolymer transport system component